MGETSDSEGAAVRSESTSLVEVYSDKDPEPTIPRPGPETITPTEETIVTQKEPDPSHPAKNTSGPPATQTADKTDETLFNPEKAAGQKKSKDKKKATEDKKDKHRDQEREKRRGRSTEKGGERSFSTKRNRPSGNIVPAHRAGARRIRPLSGKISRQNQRRRKKRPKNERNRPKR